MQFIAVDTSLNATETIQPTQGRPGAETIQALSNIVFQILDSGLHLELQPHSASGNDIISTTVF